jgi:hypothetical protein
MKPSAEELALLGLSDGDAFPAGGQTLHLTLRSGSGSARSLTALFSELFRTQFGVHLYPGTLNLWAEEPIRWENPIQLRVPGGAGEFCPVILEERAIGVAFRGNRAMPYFLEILSPVYLRDRLPDSRDEAIVTVRLLGGELLARAA